MRIINDKNNRSVRLPSYTGQAVYSEVMTKVGSR